MLAGNGFPNFKGILFGDSSLVTPSDPSEPYSHKASNAEHPSNPGSHSISPYVDCPNNEEGSSPNVHLDLSGSESGSRLAASEGGSRGELEVQRKKEMGVSEEEKERLGVVILGVSGAADADGEPGADVGSALGSVGGVHFLPMPVVLMVFFNQVRTDPYSGKGSGSKSATIGSSTAERES